MPRYDYEYFSGANISVTIGKMEVTEAVGITYNLMDSKQPIYGYSSAMFDAVAPGQILVQGSLALNFVSSNHLFNLITAGRMDDAGASYTDVAQVAAATPSTPLQPRSSLDKVLSPAEVKKAINNLIKKKRWVELDAYTDALIALNTEDSDEVTTSDLQLITKNPLSAGPVDINIRFGGPDGDNRIMLNSVFFIGRASTIQIDENVIIEEYPFFARALVTESEKVLRTG